MENIYPILCLSTASVFTICQMQTALHMMQLNSYMTGRYLKWLSKNKLQSARALLFAPVPILLCIAGFGQISLLACAAYSLFATICHFKKKQKKPLVCTKRIIRLSVALLALGLLLPLATLLLHGGLGLVSLSAFISGALAFCLIAPANLLLAPLEKSINKSYCKDAKKKLKSHPGLIVIGITGSFGKTSTKHFLHRILSEKYNVLMTPGSYNTTMGVVRTIREELKPVHQVFIVEMGAKQIGDISEICALVKPRIGILTAIAEQHLDTFGNISNITRTKFELIDALPPNGLAVLNAGFPEIHNHAKPGCQTLYYSLTNDEADFRATVTHCDSQGSAFLVSKPQTAAGAFKTALLGAHNVSNILASITVACHLGLARDDIRYAVGKLRPVRHRMEIIKTRAGITVIDDAFNANPTGAQMALDAMKLMQGGKKIIITPGIVDLAGRTGHYNKIFGTQIAATCDYAILVGKSHTGPIREGLAQAGFNPDNVYIAKNLADASRHAGTMAGPGDVLLYENDLPDNYE
jgi:UDP-N-acetylmuramoyl-tripeptide--D-alanyl-D-alanine ligase